LPTSSVQPQLYQWLFGRRESRAPTAATALLLYGDGGTDGDGDGNGDSNGDNDGETNGDDGQSVTSLSVPPLRSQYFREDTRTCSVYVVLDFNVTLL
jgi:hypothetical protein